MYYIKYVLIYWQQNYAVTVTTGGGGHSEGLAWPPPKTRIEVTGRPAMGGVHCPGDRGPVRRARGSRTEEGAQLLF